ncbi:hypothetical protein IGI04_028627 [Brassica rapa subsp. trilocularis]|uniref:Reverse transcriptase zinc-binding domain-containing protein n=1 Tax=Brassica rapa subsp. trilocularis TaxID=1813537 RepID=A0ABQ7L547_BRACM|nr:hypothetical protein IGI04_028627 [Brassica rapa subsp. trilocularis]
MEWSRVVWFPQGVPRFPFILWLTVSNMLLTGDRMRQWGITQGQQYQLGLAVNVAAFAENGEKWSRLLLSKPIVSYGSLQYMVGEKWKKVSTKHNSTEQLCRLIDKAMRNMICSLKYWSVLV